MVDYPQNHIFLNPVQESGEKIDQREPAGGNRAAKKQMTRMNSSKKWLHRISFRRRRSSKRRDEGGGTILKILNFLRLITLVKATQNLVLLSLDRANYLLQVLCKLFLVGQVCRNLGHINQKSNQNHFFGSIFLVHSRLDIHH